MQDFGACMNNLFSRWAVKRLGTVVIAVTIAWTTAACSDAQQSSHIAVTHSDAAGLIEYGMPDGWTNTRISTGNHYTREGRPDDPAVLGVIPMRRGSVPSIEQVKEGTAGKHEIQGHEMIMEETSDMNEFSVWEAVYEAEIRGQDVILHDYFLFTDELQVEVHLNTTREEYEDFLPDLRTVVGSVRARSAGD